MPRNATSKSASKSGKTAPRGPAKASTNNAIKLLTEDHKKVKELFDEFEKMKSKGYEDNDARQLIVETVCTALTIHAQIEEEIFYPAARDAIDDIDLLDEAEVEHASAKQLISELSAMQPGDELYDAKFTVLGEYVKHHIEEEEKELFPKVKKSGVDLDELGEELQQRKLELRDELGIPADDEEIDDEEKSSKSTSRKNVH
ncbi:hemerythrin domain-containing protein [Noviherbaspirillum saxi]|uniref:Hemerythrin domain-containing protein n=1 Tax=Noviherbaspirillum saxi TaxID=2320863 RepID=A0A3A3FTI3_9BURK|nr:hemerythrin domain-containing protein [Noviherbaspirillum saxi]RJF99103.1 hemerythrin domain-containing protein [Noviherbaspirillum saxi]